MCFNETKAMLYSDASYWAEYGGKWVKKGSTPGLKNLQICECQM